MAEPEQAGQARDQAERDAEAVLQAAAVYVAAAVASGAAPNPDSPDADPVRTAAKILALYLILSALFSSRREPSPDDVGINLETEAERRGDSIAREAIRWNTQHHATLAKRAKRAAKSGDAVDVPKPAAVADELVKDTAWRKAAARTLATQRAAQTAFDLLPLVEKATGETHRIMWLSRGDRRVRTLHRRLHGDVREKGQPFWRDLAGAGGVLRYPGDPKAPIGQRINCRCFLWLVPASQAATARSTMMTRPTWVPRDASGPDDILFDLVASGHLTVGAQDFLAERLTDTT